MRIGMNYFTRRANDGYAHLEAEIVVGDMTQMIWSPTYTVNDEMAASEQEALGYLCASLLALGIPSQEVTGARLDWLRERGNGYPLQELVHAEQVA